MCHMPAAVLHMDGEMPKVCNMSHYFLQLLTLEFSVIVIEQQHQHLPSVVLVNDTSTNINEMLCCEA